MNKYNSESYADQFTPANKCAHGLHLTLSDSKPFRYVGITMSIEPTEEVKMQAELQQEIDKINAATLGIRFNQLFKKK